MSVPHTNDPDDNVPEGDYEPYWSCECDRCNNHYADLADAINEQRVAGLRPTRWSRRG